MGKEKREKHHICDYPGCDKAFSRPGRLAQHIRSHTGERPYQCTHEGCNRSYARSQHLSRHILVAHNPKEKDEGDREVKQVCGVCNITFSNKHNLKKHERLHHEDRKNYLCPEKDCTEGFRKKHQLKAHLFKHQGVLPFQCAVPGCLKRFRQSSHLQAHQKYHQGYNCKEEGCERSFSKMSGLRKHKALEHRKVLRCETCEKCFHKPSDLANHVLSQSSEREKYKCPSCDRSYFAKRNLKSHIRQHHSGMKFACSHEGCDITLSTKQKLLHHKKIHQRKGKIKPKPRKKKKLVVRLVDCISGRQTEISTTSQAICTGANPENTDKTVNSPRKSVDQQPELKRLSIPTIPQQCPEASSIAQAIMGLQRTAYRDVATENSMDVHGKFPEEITTCRGKFELENQGKSCDKGQLPESALEKESAIVSEDSSEMLNASEDVSDLGTGTSESGSTELEPGCSSVVLDPSRDNECSSNSIYSNDFGGECNMSTSSHCTVTSSDINQASRLEFSSQGRDIQATQGPSSVESIGPANTDLEATDKSGAYNRDQHSYYDGTIDQPVTEIKGDVISVKATQGHKACETAQQIDNKRQMTFAGAKDPFKEDKTNSGLVVKEIQLGPSSLVQFIISEK